MNIDDVKSQARISEKEQELIKGAFEKNDILLQAMRALFLDLEVTEEEKTLVKSTFADTELLKFVTQRFYPVIRKEAPIGQVQDAWLGVEQMIFGNAAGTIFQAVNYKQQALDMTKVALALLVDPNGPRVDLEYSPKKYLNDEFQINLLARNQYIRHVEQQLLFLMLIANQSKIPVPGDKSVKKDGSK